MVNSSHLAAMLRAVALGLLVSCLAVSVSASDNDFVNCNCDDEGSWSIQSILECQRVSDFLIAIAYFSIPIELLYFVSCSNFPFKWVLLQFIAFIVLCGLTHLLNAWTYYGPHSAHSFQLMLALTISKFLTALVSCATAITLLTLFPLILKVKVRELFLRQNVLELDQEVGMMKIKKEASWHVRMLTQEIRKSLDKHNILYTTLVELSKTLDLHNCAVWMPNENRTEMNLTHELKGSSSRNYSRTIPINDPNVLEIRESKRVRILRPDSALGAASSGESSECGAVAAIRMPMLRVSNFKGGTPQLVDTPYAILVLVLPMSESRVWSYHEMEIVEVVADQVAVALSHAAVLEESQLMREKLREQNRALQQAQKNAMMASQARYSFQKVMSNGMRRPMHSILGLLSTFENMSLKQRIIVDTMVKTSYVLSTLITDVMEMSAKDNGRFPLEMRPFQLHSMIKEASCLAKCLCVYKGFRFEVDVQSSLPNQVMGDERRAFQVILHMVGSLLSTYNGEGTVIFRAVLESGSESQDDKLQQMWRTGTPDKYVSVRFEFEISDGTSHSSGVLSMIDYDGRRNNSNEIKKGLSFSICKKIVQMMQGNIWMSMNPINLAESMTLVLRFQVLHSVGRAMYVAGNLLEQPNSNSEFRGLRVVVVDDDNVNRTVTAKLLQKLGCQVSTVSSGFECLSTLGSAENPFQVVVLDLHMPEMDGFEVAMRIRKFHNPNWPLIIALTASAEESVWEKCLQMGMNGLIRKPVILKGISDELRRVLQRAGEECEGRESDAVSRQTLTSTGAKARALCSQIGEDEKMKKAEYFSKDFEWDELRVEVENDPSFSYHLLPFQPSLSVAEEAESQPWNDFHHRHSSGKFFKERRYLLQEFPELVSCEENSRVLEVGCGNGSTVLPILRGNEKVTVYACDCSTEALERAKETIYASNIVSIEHRFHTFCCDFSTSGFPTWLTYNPCQANFEQTSDGRGNSETCLNDSSSLKESRCCIGGVDFVTLIFTLSAVSLQRMPKSIKECFSVMRPGGMLLFRDYGLYDMSMLRFEMDKRVGFREYMRSDGTRSYFFSLDTVRDLFMGAGFIELELEYCCVKSLNRRNGKSMRRVWIHGKFQKPV